mgnify:CR=1 FL=1
MATRKPVTVSLPPALYTEIAALAEQQHQNLSELMRAALRQYLDDTRERRAAWKRARAYGRKKAKEQGIRSEEDVYRLMHDIRHGNDA